MFEITSQFVFCQYDLLGPTGLLINHVICLGRLLCNFFGLPRVVRLFQFVFSDIHLMSFCNSLCEEVYHLHC